MDLAKLVLYADQNIFVFYTNNFFLWQFCGINKNVFSYKKNYMRWYSLLFSVIFCSVIPNSFNHCNCQCIIIMYSYVCIMFYFCVHQNFVCHTKQVASVPSHHRPAKWSSVMSLPSILPRKSIVSLPSISPHVHADSPSQFLMKKLKLSLRTNYSKMELLRPQVAYILRKKIAGSVSLE